MRNGGECQVQRHKTVNLVEAVNIPEMDLTFSKLNAFIRESRRLPPESAQFTFALTQGFLDLASVADVDEGNDDAIDLVVDRPVWTQAHIVPLAIPAL